MSMLCAFVRVLKAVTRQLLGFCIPCPSPVALGRFELCHGAAAFLWSLGHPYHRGQIL